MISFKLTIIEDQVIKILRDLRKQGWVRYNDFNCHGLPNWSEGNGQIDVFFEFPNKKCATYFALTYMS